MARYHYPGAKDPRLAAEALRWNISREAYPEVERLFLGTIMVPESFPTERLWQSGKLKGYFLKRSDPRAPFLGNYANCCIRIGGVNEIGMWATQRSLKGGFFVLEDGRSGDLIAASRAWYVPEVNGVCFNNVEARGLEGRQREALDIYRQAAKFLVTNRQVSQVTVGTTSSDLDLESLPDAQEPVPLPDVDIGWDGRRQQKILAAS